MAHLLPYFFPNIFFSSLLFLPYIFFSGGGRRLCELTFFCHQSALFIFYEPPISWRILQCSQIYRLKLFNLIIQSTYNLKSYIEDNNSFFLSTLDSHASLVRSLSCSFPLPFFLPPSLRLSYLFFLIFLTLLFFSLFLSIPISVSLLTSKGTHRSE